MLLTLKTSCTGDISAELESRLSQSLDVSSLNQFIDQLISTDSEIKSKMAQESWIAMVKIAKLQQQSTLLMLDGETVNYDIERRQTVVKKLNSYVENVMNIWKMRRQLFKAVRLKVRDLFKHYIVEVLRVACQKTQQIQEEKQFRQSFGLSIEGNSREVSTIESIVHSTLESYRTESFSFIRAATNPAYMSPSEWYDCLLSNTCENEQEANSKKVLSQREKMRLDTITPMISHNFQEVFCFAISLMMS
jgi:hypothetical protein